MKITKKNIKASKPFITKDTSIIRSILDLSNAPVKKQSLAEAVVKPGKSTEEHLHEKTEEIYYFVQGKGILTINNQPSTVNTGDAVLLPPGTSHKFINTGKKAAKILCCCAPPYSHKDTVITEQKYKMIIFDFDGTLADTLGGILATANIMAKIFKTKPYTRKKIALTIGTGLDSFLNGLFPAEYRRRGAAEMIKIYRKIYDGEFKAGLKVFPGVADTLKYLKNKGIKMIIVSNKLKRYVEDIVKLLKLDSYFEEVMGSAEQKLMKPHPWAIGYYMKKYKAAKHETMMVGDSQYDVEAGKRAGVVTVFLSHGYADMKIVNRLKPEYYLDSIKKIKGIV